MAKRDSSVSRAAARVLPLNGGSLSTLEPAERSVVDSKPQLLCQRSATESTWCPRSTAISYSATASPAMIRSIFSHRAPSHMTLIGPQSRLLPNSGEISRAVSAFRMTCPRDPQSSLLGDRTVTSSLLPVSILGFVIVSYIALRPFPSRVRNLFDFVCFVGATFILLRHHAFPLPGSGGAANGTALWLRAVAGIWWLLGARVLVAVMSFTLNHNRRWREARLFPDLTAAVIYTAAVAVVLISVLALPIGGLLATSGVLAIVLGLALQNTLADVFAGIAFGIESPLNVGDRISLADKIEGTVVQMNWRSIRIHTDGDDIAIVPNSVVAKSDIVNRSFPTHLRSSFIEFSCPATADPERVIDTLQQATLLCPTILPVPPSSAALTRLGSTESQYRVTFSVADTKYLSTAKDLLLRHARRQLYYTGLYIPRAAQDIPAPGESTDRLFHTVLPLLQDITLFEALEAEQLAEIAVHLKPRSLEPGDVLFAQEGSEATLFIVASGILEISQLTELSGPQTAGYIGAGDYIGEISLLTGAPYAATATARTHCKLYGLDRNVIGPLLAGNADLYAEFDRSARHGLTILHRGVAVRATDDSAGQSLLHRIRSFFANPP
jgi:small-conductance mechanosensitive channel/CRP-like cAMP-binding protein